MNCFRVSFGHVGWVIISLGLALRLSWRRLMRMLVAFLTIAHDFCLSFVSEFIVVEGCIQDSGKSDLIHDRATLAKSVSIWSGLII